MTHVLRKRLPGVSGVIHTSDTAAKWPFRRCPRQHCRRLREVSNSSGDRCSISSTSWPFSGSAGRPSNAPNRLDSFNCFRFASGIALEKHPVVFLDPASWLAGLVYGMWASHYNIQ
ncbi:hypothetical protein DAPPUDRAFT_306934 [Daphnia pulex]|uniref:Uncharacterized protein n=1 Tax=Daphnia pulex TaxID=6669 RepID=E9H020_DAPPU|nr:hypothetical protein DAPPUDRAFT_306934 [Daphnia pulex]|eukprot:EFX74919.1 hypothetical protein DAPPUDRAFT_306934 [Daphnia pulex]